MTVEHNLREWENAVKIIVDKVMVERKCQDECLALQQIKERLHINELSVDNMNKSLDTLTKSITELKDRIMYGAAGIVITIILAFILEKIKR